MRHLVGAIVLGVAASVPATAADRLHVWVGGADHPAGIPSLPNRVDVPIQLQIGSDGSLRCVPAAIKNHAELRRPSCALVVARGVFGPNFDKGGSALATRVDLVVRWLPGSSDLGFGGALPVSPDLWIQASDYPLRAILGGTNVAAFTVTASGRIADCHITTSSRYEVLDGAVCPLLRQRALLLPALDKNGDRTTVTGRFVNRWPW